jgi:hypothetical protein
MRLENLLNSGVSKAFIGWLGRGNKIAQRGLSQAIQIALAIGGAIENSLSEFVLFRIVDWKGQFRQRFVQGFCHYSDRVLSKRWPSKLRAVEFFNQAEAIGLVTNFDLCGGIAQTGLCLGTPRKSFERQHGPVWQYEL